jgi:uncharacterized repeat protein (TIGR01451 family)
MDRYVTPEEDIIRRINIDNVVGVEQRDLEFNYYTDIGEVLEPEFFEIVRDDVVISSNITMNDNIKLIIEEDTSYKGTGKKYKLFLSKLLAREENTELGIITADREADITEIRIKERMIGESIPDSNTDTFPRTKWHMNDIITYGEIEQGTTRKLSTVDPITGVVKSTGSVPMVRDYGNGLFKGGTENDESDGRHYLVTFENLETKSKEEVRLGDDLTSEETPKGNLDVNSDNGLVFENSSIKSNLKNLVPLNISHSGYISVWLSNNPETNKAYDSEYSIPLIEQLEVNLENLTDNDYMKVVNGKPYLILDIPSLPDYIANSTQTQNTNDGYKYIRIRYALEKKDVESSTGYAKTGEVEDYKVLVGGGLEVQFEKDEGATNYIPKDLGFYEGNWNEDWSLKGTELKYKGGFDDGYIGYQEYVKHRIKIKNPIDYPQINKSFVFTTSLGEITNLNGMNNLNLIPGNSVIKFVSSTIEDKTVNITVLPYEKEKFESISNEEYTNMKQYEIIVDKLEPNEEIVIEFVEKVVNEDIARGNKPWYLVDKIFVDKENPGKYSDRIFQRELEKDYGSAYKINGGVANSENVPRHYLGKVNGEDKFVQLINLDVQNEQTIVSEDSPKDDTTENNGITFENIENGKAVLKNNFINEIKVRASHDGFIRIQMTDTDTTLYDWNNTTMDVLREKVAEDNYQSVKILPIKGGIDPSTSKQYENTIYIQVPFAPNTEQLLRIRYALDEKDLEDDTISKIGEIEEYVVIIGASVDVSFVDSEHKTKSNEKDRDKAIEEVVFKKSENGLIKDLGIGVDRGGVDISDFDNKKLLFKKFRAGYHDGQLSVGEDFMEIIRIENLTNIDQTTATDIELRNNIEYVFVDYYLTDGNFELFINRDLAASEELFKKGSDFSQYVDQITDSETIKAYLDIKPLTSTIQGNDLGDYKHRYQIKLNKIEKNTALYLKFRCHISAEAENSKVESGLFVDGNFKEELVHEMIKDYSALDNGRSYAVGISELEAIEGTKVNPLLTNGNINNDIVARLGSILTIEDKSSENDLQEDDGVDLPKYDGILTGQEGENKQKILVLYNNFYNLLPVNASRDGYLRFWLGDLLKDLNNNDTWIPLERGKNRVSRIEMIEPDDFTESPFLSFSVVGEKSITNEDKKANNLSIKLPDVLRKDYAGKKDFYTTNLTYILKARYSLLKNDANYEDLIWDEQAIAALSFNMTGEIEDYKVKVIPGLDVKFTDTEDLGVVVSEDYEYDNDLDKLIKQERVGYSDENISLVEYVLQTIEITNLSRLSQEPQEITIRINTGDIIDFVKLESIERTFDINTNVGQEIEKEPVIIEDISSRIEDSNISLLNTKSINYSELNLRIKDLKGRETLRLTYLVKVNRENLVETTDNKDNAKDKAGLFIQKAYDTLTDIQLAQKNLVMNRDYGDNFIGNYDATTDARHYITEGEKYVYLGKIIEEEYEPKVNENNDNDGVVFDTVTINPNTNEKINYLYNDLSNKITINPTYNGYISIWLSENNNSQTTWNDAIRLKLKIQNSEETEVETLQVEGKETDIIFDLGDVLSEENSTKERILRVRYAVHKSDVQSPVGAARTGEVEDYKVEIRAGSEVKFGELKEKTGYQPKDLGISYTEEMPKIFGNGDGNYVPNEIIEHTITMINYTNTSQTDEEVVLNTNVLGEFIGYSENSESLCEVLDLQKVRIAIPENVKDLKGYKYLIRINEILPKSSTTVKLLFRVTEENLNDQVYDNDYNESYKFHIKDRLIHRVDKIAPKFVPFDTDNKVSLVEMKRDYLGRYIDKKSGDMGIRHYIITGENKAYLGEIVKDEYSLSISTDDMDDNDGVIFLKQNDENILYNALNNKITIKVKGTGYVSAWLLDEEEETTNNNLQITQLEFKTSDGTTEKIKSVVSGENVLEFEVPDYLKDRVNITDIVEKIFVIRFTIDRSELEQEPRVEYSIGGEIEEHKVKIVEGLDAVFGNKTDVKYEVSDLGFVSEDGIIVGANDGNLVPGEIVEHTITIINDTGAVQKDKFIYFEGKLENLLTTENQNFDLITPEVNGVITSIVEENGKIKINFTDLNFEEGNNYITFKFKTIVKEDVDRKTTIYETENFEVKARLIVGYKVPSFESEKIENEITNRKVVRTIMERDYPSVGEVVDRNIIHFRAGTIIENNDNKMISDLYKLGEKYSVETDITQNDDRDGIIKVNGQDMKQDQDFITKGLIQLTRGQDNTITVNASKKGYITLWITGNNATKTNNDWTLIGSFYEITGETSEQELLIEAQALTDAFNKVSTFNDNLDPADKRYLKIRYSAEKKDILDATGYARSGETEEYLVYIQNITGEKTSIGQGGDDKVEAGERVTYTLLFTNDSGIDNIGIVKISDNLENILKDVAKLDENSIRVVQDTGEYVDGSNGNVTWVFDRDILDITVNNFNKKYLKIEFDIVINNPVDIKEGESIILNNTAEVIESGVKQEIPDINPPEIVAGKVELISEKDYEAYRPDEEGKIDYTPLEGHKAFSKNEVESVVVLPNDIVRYFIKIKNTGKITSWYPTFTDDLTGILAVSDFVEGSFKAVNEAGKDIPLFIKDENGISLVKIKDEDVNPKIIEENGQKVKKLEVTLEKISEGSYVLISFDVKVKEHVEGIKYPYPLENTAIIKPTTNENDNISSSTEGPHLDSLLEVTKTSSTASDDDTIQIGEEFSYTIVVENYSLDTVENIMVKDDLAKMLSFATLKNITLTILGESGNIVENKDITNKVTNNIFETSFDLLGKERAEIKIAFTAGEDFSKVNEILEEDGKFYNNVIINSQFPEETTKDEGLKFDMTVQVTKENRDEATDESYTSENGRIEPYENLVYTIKLYNPSGSVREVNFKDVLTENIKGKDGTSKDELILFDVIDVEEDSIRINGNKTNDLSYDSKNKEISGKVNVPSLGEIIIEFVVKLKVPIADGIEEGDFLVNKAVVIDGEQENEATAEIPIDYRIQVLLESKIVDTFTDEIISEPPKEIVETGQTIKYIFTFINPFNRNVILYGRNDLSAQKEYYSDEILHILGNIPYYTDMNLQEGEKPKIEYLGKEVNDEENTLEAFANNGGEEKESIGIEGAILLRPMEKDVEGSGITTATFRMKVDDELPLDVEEAIEKAIEKGIDGIDKEEDAVPVHNAGKFIEERYLDNSNSIRKIKNSRVATENVIIAKDPEPPYLLAIERGNDNIRISKQANKEQVSVGDLVAYEIEVENIKERGGISNVYICDKLPPGFRYVKGTARLYRKNESEKYVKEKVEPSFDGKNGKKEMIFFIKKLEEKENLKITYILRVGTGVSPNIYENLAVAKNKKGEDLSNEARALVEVVLDRLFDMSTVIGKVFHDRDGDGWQDDANAYDVKVRTLTHKNNYENIDGWYVNTNKYYWYYTRIKNGELGDIDGRELETEEIPKLILRRRIKDPEKVSILEITTDSGLHLTMLPNGKVIRIEKGALRRGEVGENLRVNRKIVKVYGMYYEQLEFYNFGIHEEGIAGAKLSTVDGLVVTTDKYGRYHIEEIPIESVRGNNFIIKVDPVTLPVGSKFTTPNPLVKRIGHVMEKYNFGVQYPTDIKNKKSK